MKLGVRILKFIIDYLKRILSSSKNRVKSGNYPIFVQLLNLNPNRNYN